MIETCLVGADAWSKSPGHSNNTRAQRWLVSAHYRVGVNTQSTLSVMVLLYLLSNLPINIMIC